MEEIKYYGVDFYKDLEAGSVNSANLVVPILIDIIKPKSVIDVGCGSGNWLEAFEKNKITDYVGVDGEFANLDMLKIPREKFFLADLKDTFSVGRKFDLAISFEVGEHLPDSSSKIFVESITRHADIVAFSAAIPGQVGTYHINEQPHSYWHDRFASQSYQLFDVIRPKMWYTGQIQTWYRQNIFLYVKKERVAALNLKNTSSNLPDVHPETFFRWNKKNNILSQFLSKPGYVINRFLHKRI